jgi:hypothetical protein
MAEQLSDKGIFPQTHDFLFIYLKKKKKSQNNHFYLSNWFKSLYLKQEWLLHEPTKTYTLIKMPISEDLIWAAEFLQQQRKTEVFQFIPLWLFRCLQSDLQILSSSYLYSGRYTQGD